MNIKKLLLIFLIIFILVGCTKIDDLSYDEIINMVSIKENDANVYKKGYKFYIPKGLAITNAGTNYAIISNKNINYYLYIDIVSYNSSKNPEYEIKPNSYYSNLINYNGNNGYIEINLRENNKYLIEIMYNYAKIEVMVDKNMINEVLINSISILKSIKYNSKIIEKLLNDDNLDYTEEIFDIFENKSNNTNVLDYVDADENTSNNEEIKDTDFIN